MGEICVPMAGLATPGNAIALVDATGKDVTDSALIK
jgi:hypothetical protein